MMCYVASFFSKTTGAKRFCTPPTFCISFLWRWPRCRGQRSFHRSTVGSQRGSGPFGTTYQGLCTKWRAAVAEDGRISVTCLFFWGGVDSKGLKELLFVPLTLTTHLPFGPHFPLNHDSGKKQVHFYRKRTTRYPGWTFPMVGVDDWVFLLEWSLKIEVLKRMNRSSADRNRETSMLA